MNYNFKFSLGDRVRCKVFSFQGDMICLGTIIGCSINNINEETYDVSLDCREGDDVKVLREDIICKLYI